MYNRLIASCLLLTVLAGCTDATSGDKAASAAGGSDARVTCAATVSGEKAIFTFHDGDLVNYSFTGGYVNNAPITRPGKFIIGGMTVSDIRMKESRREFSFQISGSTGPGKLKAWCDKPLGPLVVHRITEADTNLAGLPPLDEAVILAPKPDVPAEFAAFSGSWSGSWAGGVVAKLAVQSISPAGEMEGAYAWGDHPDGRFRGGSRPVEGWIQNGVLKLQPFTNGARLSFKMHPDGQLSATYLLDGANTAGEFRLL